MRLLFWPKRLAGQFLLLLFAALLLSQAMTALLMFEERRNALLLMGQRDIGDRIYGAVQLLRASPQQLHPEVLRATSSESMRFWLSESSSLESVPSAQEDQKLIRLIRHRMRSTEVAQIRAISQLQSADERSPTHLPKPQLNQSHFHNSNAPTPTHQPPEHIPHNEQSYRAARWTQVELQLADGRWLNATSHLRVVAPLWATANILSAVLMAMTLVITVIVMVKRITKPLRLLSDAANRLGRGEEVPPLPEIGPDDLKQTTESFNRMNLRLQRFVKDRTTMLASLSHDLRTPITTLRLRAELLEDEQIQQAFLNTLDEMQAMADATLAFVREEAAIEQTRSLELSALLDSICDDLAANGNAVTFRPCPAYFYNCRPVALKRCLNNLIGNAVKYGGAAQVTMQQDDNQLSIRIEDQGPGIPANQIEEIFKPFVRLEVSRNPTTGGAGLGLAIARSIARSHGGDIILTNLERGGLRAELVLPLGD